MTDGQYPPPGQYSGPPQYAPPGPPVPAVPPPGDGTNKTVVIIVAVAAAVVVAMVAIVGVVLVSRDSGSPLNPADTPAAASGSTAATEYDDVPADFRLHGSIQNKLAACSALVAASRSIPPRTPPYDFGSSEMFKIKEIADSSMKRLASTVSPQVEEPFRSTLQSYISAYYKVNRSFEAKNSAEMQFWSGQTDQLAAYMNRQCNGE